MRCWFFVPALFLTLNACASNRSIGLGAVVSFNNYDYQVAAKQYAELMAHNPTNEQVYNLSIAYLATGEAHRARPFLYYLHEQDTRNTTVLEAIMYAEFTLGEWEQAHRMIERLQAIDPYRVSAWYYQAQLLSRQLQHEVAIELLLAVYTRRAVPQVALALAQNYEAVGNKAEAQAWSKLGNLVATDAGTPF